VRQLYKTIGRRHAPPFDPSVLPHVPQPNTAATAATATDVNAPPRPPRLGLGVPSSLQPAAIVSAAQRHAIEMDW
jgi:hypothetical protein